VPSRGLEPGRRIAFAVHSDEVLLARGATGVISARNRLPARVECLADAGGAVRVDARLLAQGRGSLLSATVTRGAVEELGLAPGAEVECVFKASACRVWSAAVR
jgi:molybdopterin-binding protein